MKTYKIPESVLVVIYSENLDVLLIERAGHPDFWQSVTGSRATQDEALVDTAKREVFEETGIFISDANPEQKFPCVSLSALSNWQKTNTYEIYPSWRYRYAPGVTTNTEHVFGLCIPRNTIITLSPKEHLRFMWLPYQEAAQKCFSSSNRDAILELPQKTKRT